MKTISVGAKGWRQGWKREGGIARDKGLRLKEQLNHAEIMSVYLKMIGGEQKECIVGGVEIS